MRLSVPARVGTGRGSDPLGCSRPGLEEFPLRRCAEGLSGPLSSAGPLRTPAAGTPRPSPLPPAQIAYCALPMRPLPAPQPGNSGSGPHMLGLILLAPCLPAEG